MSRRKGANKPAGSKLCESPAGLRRAPPVFHFVFCSSLKRPEE